MLLLLYQRGYQFSAMECLDIDPKCSHLSVWTTLFLSLKKLFLDSFCSVHTSRLESAECVSAFWRFLGPNFI